MPEFKINDNLELRTLQEEDVLVLAGLVKENLPHLQPWMLWAVDDYDARHAGDFIRQNLANTSKYKAPSYGIFYEGELIGCIGFVKLDVESRLAEIGYWISAEHEGKGLITECTRTLIEYCFDELNIARIEIRAAASNERSRAIPEKFGFKLTGQFKDEHPLPDSKIDDLVIYEITAREWRSLSNKQFHVKFKEMLIRLFRRETSSKEFIPVIDGLRFLAIAMVLVFHLDGYIKEKSAALSFAPVSDSLAKVPDIFIFGFQGVQLFFVISGFILAVPFMRYALGLTDKKPRLRAYYLRRLTRLEPPYVISTIVIFLLLVFVIGSKYPLGTLTVSLFSSLFYAHFLVFPGEPPYINQITWSLEMEVQFYLLAPFLVGGLCLLRNKSARRIVNLLLILSFAGLSWLQELYWHVGIMNISMYLHYFLAGILLCDVFLLDSDKLGRLSNTWIFILGLLLLVPITCVNHSYAPNIALRMASPIMILAFYLIVFGNKWWNKIFSLNGLTLIGGMCYSIYLLHYVTISAVGRFTANRLYQSNFAVYYWMQIFVLLAVVMFLSAIYFLLIEKPCMKRDWHIRLYKKLKGLSFTKSVP
ncbi:MAG TPA: GNAT family N-acetyltransferase [Pyrinomonadaceae bacterium]|jgi:peptidoglycan/LPS O-acetylase OafA/YrhL/RimJ/RimL family protein N-acetyltransferase|nr:GNAT family N-acetyltransferase [Pyrinomonadaceae bacterium]